MIKLNKRIIYYGIESYDFVRENIENWVNITGKPEVFAASTSNIKNYVQEFLGYSIITIDDALDRYSDADIYITFSKEQHARKAAEDLLQKTTPDKIHFLNVELEYKKNCTRLGKWLFFESNSFVMCTVFKRYPRLFVTGTIHERIEKWKDFSEKLIAANQIDAPNKCLNCHFLKYGFYPRQAKVMNLRFVQDLAMDSCNLRCFYCSSVSKNKFKGNMKKTGYSTYDVVKALSEMPNYVESGEDFTVTFSNGEFCANKYHDEIVEVLLHNEWRIELVSNFSIYREKLAQLMETGRIYRVITSIDSGTRETFKRIKGNDRFDIVIENLRKYPIHKTKMCLKYIILEGINDNETDIDGFIKIAKDVNANIWLSTDKNTSKKPMIESTHLRELIIDFVRKGKKEGLLVTADANNINPADTKFIRDTYTRA